MCQKIVVWMEHIYDYNKTIMFDSIYKYNDTIQNNKLHKNNLSYCYQKKMNIRLHTH